MSLLGSMPHVASDENWTTTFTLVNTGPSDAQTELNFLGDSGNPLQLPLLLPQQSADQSLQTTSSFDWTLASNASLIVQTASLANQPMQIGSAQLTASAGTGGFAMFHLYSYPTRGCGAFRNQKRQFLCAGIRQHQQCLAECGAR